MHMIPGKTKRNHPCRLFLAVLFLTAVCAAASAPSPAAALSVPPLQGYVNDNAGLLSQGSRNALTVMLNRFEKQTGNQVVLLTIPSLEGDSLEDFSMSVAEQWKVGQKGKDNGVIFLVSEEDRKMRIEVGYGLEGVLTDAKSSRIIRNVVAPYFRQGQYDTGILAGMQAILGGIGGGEALPADTGRVRLEKRKSAASGLIMFLFLLFLLFSRTGRFVLVGGMLGGMMGGGGMRRGGFGGGGFGGFGGGGGGGFGGGGASGGW